MILTRVQQPALVAFRHSQQEFLGYHPPTRARTYGRPDRRRESRDGQGRDRDERREDQ